MAAGSAIRSCNFIGADCTCAEFHGDFAGGGRGGFRAAVLKILQVKYDIVRSIDCSGSHVFTLSTLAGPGYSDIDIMILVCARKVHQSFLGRFSVSMWCVVHVV